MRTRKYASIEREYSSNLFPDYSAGLWYIYMLTDAQRSVLHCGICSNLSGLLGLMDESTRFAPTVRAAALDIHSGCLSDAVSQPGSCASSASFASFSSCVPARSSFVEQGKLRMVYVEGIASCMEAEQHLERLIAFTRLQKERLVRKNNPNWVDLGLRLKTRMTATAQGESPASTKSDFAMNDFQTPGRNSKPRLRTPALHVSAGW